MEKDEKEIKKFTEEDKKFIYDLADTQNKLIIYTELATVIGLNESIIYHQIKYWLENNKKKNRNIKDGRIWVYNSISEWKATNFPFWSEATIRRTINNLVKLGLIVESTKNYNTAKFDKTKWYSIDMPEYKVEKEVKIEVEVEPLMNRCMQNAQIDDSKLHKPIPKINQKLNQFKNSEKYKKEKKAIVYTSGSDSDNSSIKHEIVTPGDFREFSHSCAGEVELQRSARKWEEFKKVQNNYKIN